MSKKLQLLQIGENIVPLVIRYEIRSSLRVSFGREVINVRIPKQMGLSIVEEQYKLAKDWITKTFEVYIDQIRKEVHDVNNLHFGKPINQVRLKYNKSNWGSCSSKGNINLSSRLLLVPRHIRQYVIVHELAHLIEMNHSAKYWKVVEQVYPSYKLAENWLKDNSSLVDF